MTSLHSDKNDWHSITLDLNHLPVTSEETKTNIKNALFSAQNHLCDHVHEKDLWDDVIRKEFTVVGDTTTDLRCMSCFSPLNAHIMFFELRRLIPLSDGETVKVKIVQCAYHAGHSPKFVKCEFMGCNKIAMFDERVLRSIFNEEYKPEYTNISTAEDELYSETNPNRTCNPRSVFDSASVLHAPPEYTDQEFSDVYG